MVGETIRIVSKICYRLNIYGIPSEFNFFWFNALFEVSLKTTLIDRHEMGRNSTLFV